MGIGGKLDGTNVLRPRVSVITNVGLDHTDILGETLVEIAADKAGIAKPGIPLVSAVEDPGAREVIERACRQAGAPFLHVLDCTQVEEGAGAAVLAAVLPLPRRARHTTSFCRSWGCFSSETRQPAILALEQLPTIPCVRKNPPSNGDLRT